MSQKNYSQWVEQAKKGDLDSFSRLVETFQDLATGAAFGWLGDLETARDVSQEAFLDAYAHLADLREPAAFPAWLRRIVLKHCDRLTRIPTPAREVLNPTSISSGEILEDEAARNEEASGLRFAVGRLPAHERIVVALTYFAQLSGAESAEFMGLPVSTIKKRLRNARQRLRAQGENLMPHSMDHWRPSHSHDFTEVVAFFLAIRQGDRDRVRHLLDGSPGLVDAVQEWEPDLVNGRLLPFPSRATALITAIERDDIALLKLLLDAGADVDGRCEHIDATYAPQAAPYSAQLRLDRKRAARGLYPAVHPAMSWSRALHAEAVGAEHVRIAHAARELLESYSEEDPDLLAVEKASVTDPHFASQARNVDEHPVGGRSRAISLLCYLAQPFFVTEPFTGRQGVSISQGTLLDDLNDILAGWSGDQTG